MSWDANSHDPRRCAKLQRFVCGTTVRWNGREYRYPGFVEKEGVRYLGQSVLLVRHDRLPELVAGLTQIGIEFEVDAGSVG